VDERDAYYYWKRSLLPFLGEPGARRGTYLGEKGTYLGATGTHLGATATRRLLTLRQRLKANLSRP
jgi:hypothetical protein